MTQAAESGRPLGGGAQPSVHCAANFGYVRPIASPLDAVRIAREVPGRTVVFHAVGFETTLAPIAGMIQEGLPDNLLLLVSGRLTWPAVAMLLDSEEPGFDALIAPGHVSTVMGPEEWTFVPAVHQVPAAIAGFTPDSLLPRIVHGACIKNPLVAEIMHGKKRSGRPKLPLTAVQRLEIERDHSGVPVIGVNDVGPDIKGNACLKHSP